MAEGTSIAGLASTLPEELARDVRGICGHVVSRGNSLLLSTAGEERESREEGKPEKRQRDCREHSQGSVAGRHTTAVARSREQSLLGGLLGPSNLFAPATEAIIPLALSFLEGMVRLPLRWCRYSGGVGILCVVRRKRESVSRRRRRRRQRCATAGLGGGGEGLRCGLEGQDWTYCRWFSSFLSWFAIGQNRRKENSSLRAADLES